MGRTQPARSSPGILPNARQETVRPVPLDGETGRDLVFHVVGDTGFEPVTSSVSRKRAPTAPIALAKPPHYADGFEVGTGFEPVYTALQAVASPLGHPTVVTIRADDGIRTRDPHLGKVMRYQLRYVRTAISYLATDGNFSRPSSPMPNRYPDSVRPGGASWGFATWRATGPVTGRRMIATRCTAG